MIGYFHGLPLQTQIKAGIATILDSHQIATIRFGASHSMQYLFRVPIDLHREIT